jgi:alpha-glucosidase
MLSLYRQALHLRRGLPALHAEEFAWLDLGGDDVLAFTRGAGFACVANLGTNPVPLPAGATVLLASGPVDGVVGPDIAVWLGLPS